jgi:peptidoglycan/LPS O-acetylase OafA/YrhL
MLLNDKRCLLPAATIKISLTALGLLGEDNMQRIDKNYIMIGLVWVLVGMIFGIWLGASNHMNFANSHAHINLLGFVVSSLFGIFYWAYPNMAKSKLAMWQFIIYEVGVAILVVGKVMIDNNGSNNPFLVAGSLITIIGTAMMLYLFATAAE